MITHTIADEYTDTVVKWQWRHSIEEVWRAVDLWERLIGAYDTSMTEDERGWNRYLPMIGVEHLGALIASDGAESDDYLSVTLTLVSYSDYGGSTLDAANLRDLDGMPGVNTYTGRTCHGDSAAWIQLGELPGDAEDSVADGLDRLEELCEAIEHIEQSGYLSDETLYEYEAELQDEAWDAWLRSDLLSDIDDALDTDDPDSEPLDWETAPIRSEFQGDPRDRDDIIRCAYYECESNEWICESATSATNYRHDAALAHVLATVYGIEGTD